MKKNTNRQTKQSLDGNLRNLSAGIRFVIFMFLLTVIGCGSAPVTTTPPSSQAGKLLLDQLLNGKPMEREQAALAMSKLPDPAFIPVLINVADTDTQIKVRAAAIQALGVLRASDAVQVALKNLKHPDEQIRKASCEALGMLKPDEGILPLKEMLKDESSHVRMTALTALGNYGAKAESILMEIYKNGTEHEKVVVGGIFSKGGFGNTASLMTMTLTADSDALRRTAAQTLARMKDESAIEALVKMAHDPLSPRTHESFKQRAEIDAGEAEVRLIKLDLDKILISQGRRPTGGDHNWLDAGKTPEEKQATRNNAWKNYLKKALKEQTAMMSQVAIEALEQIGSTKARAAILNFMNETTPDKQFLAEIAKEVIRANKTQWQDYLYEVLEDQKQSAAVRRRTLQLLTEKETGTDVIRGKVEDPQANDVRLHKALVAALKDEDSSYVLHCAQLLAKTAAPEAIDTLIAMLSSERMEIRRGAVDALQHYNDPRAVKPLLAIITDKLAIPADVSADPEKLKLYQANLFEAQKGALRRLGALKDKSVVPALLEIALKKHPLQRDALLALGGIGDTSIGPKIFELYKSADPKDRDTGALRDVLLEVFGQLKVKEAVELLIGYVERYDEKELGQIELAMNSLSLIGDPRAIDPLVKALYKKSLRDKYDEHRPGYTGIPALARFGDPVAIDVFVYLVKATNNGAQTPNKAADALIELKHPKGVEALIGMLADPELDPGRKNSAVGPALAKAGDAVVPQLIQLLLNAPPVEEDKTGVTDPGFLAAQLLGFIGSAALEPIKKVLAERNADRHIMGRCIVALQNIKDPAVLGILEALVRHPDPKVQQWAAVGLAETKLDAAFEKLANLKSSADAELQAVITRLLNRRSGSQNTAAQ